MDSKFQGVIDIGSNSVRLMIVRVSNKIETVFADLNTTRLYENISDDYTLHDVSMKRTIEAIIKYVEIAKEHKVENLYLFGTAAVRVAKNKDIFLQQVKDNTGFTIDVLSEDMEAKMAFAGVNAKGNCGIIDIGGASTEIALGCDEKVFAATSFKMGAVKGKEILESDVDIKGIVNWAKDVLKQKNSAVFSHIKTVQDITWYGVGGTITTVAAIMNSLEEYNSEIINSTVVNINDVKKIVNKISKMSIEERKQIKGLQAKRADIIVFGLGILIAVMEQSQIKKIYASDNDNLVGYLRLKQRSE